MNGTITSRLSLHTQTHRHIFWFLVGIYLRLTLRGKIQFLYLETAFTMRSSSLFCSHSLVSRLLSFHNATYRTSVLPPNCRKMNSLIRTSSQTRTLQISAAALCMASKQFKFGINPLLLLLLYFILEKYWVGYRALVKKKKKSILS